MNKALLILLLAGVFLLIDWYAYQLFRTAFSGFSDQSQRIIKWVYIGFIILALSSFFFYHFGNPDALGKHARTFLMSIVFMHYLAKIILVLFALLDDAQRGIRWLMFKLSNPEPSHSEGGISRSDFIAKTGIVVSAAPIIILSWVIISGTDDYRVR